MDASNAESCSMSNSDAGDHPPDFLELLYGEDSDYEGQVDEEMFFTDEETDRVARNSLSPQQSRVRDRSRSRSPLQDPRVVVLAYSSKQDPSLEEYIAPEPYAVCEDSTECLSEISADRGNSRRKSSRGRVRCRRIGYQRTRGQTRGRGSINRRQRGWYPGQPLEEIWITDDDVPLELREMLRDVIRKRKERVEGMEAWTVIEGHDSETESDDVYEDAIDGTVNSLMTGVDHQFEWSTMETFENVEESFVPKRTGSVSIYTNPYDAFRSFWDDGILQLIVDETNRYASRIQSPSFQARWYPTNAHELLCLFAFWMMAGIIRMPTINSYFSSNSLLKTEVFSRITTLRRYIDLNRALYFVDTSLPAKRTSDPMDRLILNRTIDHLNNKFQSNYVMSKDISLHIFKQDTQSKAVKFSVKTFELSESATGYLWSFLLRTGTRKFSDRGLATVVLKLIQPLLNKGYRLFTDNWFNSPLLARILKRNGTDCVGKVRASHVDIPRLFVHAPLKQGQLIARHSGDVSVLSWQDKERINMISTCHGSAIGLSNVSSRGLRPEVFKPQSVLDYNRAMGGAGFKDQILEPYLLERMRATKWCVKIFKRLINYSIHNSRILLESSRKTREDSLKFRLELVHTILSLHHSLIPLDRRAVSHFKTPFHLKVHHTHWPVRLPQTEVDMARNRQSRKKCFICLQEGRKTQKTSYKCEDCSVPLCVENCFKKYHTSFFQ